MVYYNNISGLAYCNIVYYISVFVHYNTLGLVDYNIISSYISDPEYDNII